MWLLNGSTEPLGKRGFHPAVLVGAGSIGTLLVVGVVALVLVLSYKPNQPPVAQDNTSKVPSLNASNPVKDQSVKRQPTKDEPRAYPPSKFKTPEDVVKAYLAAATWEERLPCVLNPQSVRSQMSSTYKNIDLTNTQKQFRPGTNYLGERRPTAVGERVIVKLNVSQGFPNHEYLQFAVVRTEEGFKVDWLETMKLSDVDNERAVRNGLKLGDPVIEVRVLKVYQSTLSEDTYLDVRVTNKSNKHIAFWCVGADLSGAGSQYLGHGITTGSNLRPGQSATKRMIYSDIKATEVQSWKLDLEGLTIDLGGGKRLDAIKYFTLSEVD